MPAKVVPIAAARPAASPGDWERLTDEDLMLLVRAGSREAMSTLASRHVGALTGFSVKFTGDAATAEDIVQEVFLRLWIRRADWQPRGRVLGLLYTVARNLCRNRARDARRRSRWLLPDNGNLDAASLHVEGGDVESVLSQERHRDTMRALGELPEAMREALLLRFDAEMPYEAIAEIVGAPESELQSGIFSHAVRSGLLGGADTDGDGRITYDEVRGFIDVASASIDNPLYRPKVFARGPNGHGDEPIFDLTGARALSLELEGREQRVTVRDSREIAWIDVHKEAGARATLRLPIDRAAGASVDERDPHSAGGQVVSRRSVEVRDSSGPVPIASLELRPPEARGPNELLAKLFASPFGPHAFADWREQTSHESEPVYGISSEDAERMRLLLFEVAEMQRQWRHAGGALMLAAGVGLAAAGTWPLLDRKLPLADPTVLGYTLIGEGGAIAIGGACVLAFPRDGEHLYDDYVRAMANPPIDGARVVAETEKRLFEMADSARHWRHVLAPVAWSLLALSAGLFAIDQATDNNPTRRLELGTIDAFVGFGALTVATASSVPLPIERMVDLWANDPAIQRLPRAVERPTVSIVPLRGGGAAISITGAL